MSHADEATSAGTFSAYDFLVSIRETTKMISGTGGNNYGPSIYRTDCVLLWALVGIVPAL